MAAIIGAIGGAILALLIIIPLFLSGLLQPANSQANIQATENMVSRVGINEEQITQNLVGFSVMNEQVNALRDQVHQQEILATQVTQSQDLLDEKQQTLILETSQSATRQSDIDAALEALQNNSPTAFDPSEINQNIATLGAQIEAIAAGASTQDAQKLTSDLGDLQTAMASLKTQVEEERQNTENARSQLAQQISEQDQSLSEIVQLANQRLLLINQQSAEIQRLVDTTQNLSQSAEIAQTTPEIIHIAPQELAPTQAYKIQAALNGAELALANGQPYLTHLDRLKSQLPDLVISEEISKIAAQGLPTPGQIIAQFNSAIPDMLAVRPPEPNAGWMSQIGNSVKSALAIRPTGLTNGDPIENMLNQALAAVERSDFSAAFSLLEGLPNPMYLVVDELALKIRQFGDSQILLADIQNLVDQNQLPPAPSSIPAPSSPPASIDQNGAPS